MTDFCPNTISAIKLKCSAANFKFPAIAAEVRYLDKMMLGGNLRRCISDLLAFYIHNIPAWNRIFNGREYFINPFFLFYRILSNSYNSKSHRIISMPNNCCIMGLASASVPEAKSKMKTKQKIRWRPKPRYSRNEFRAMIMQVVNFKISSYRWDESDPNGGIECII